MKFSEQWLRTFVNPEISSQALADSLSMAGLEVDDLSPVADAFNGVVVAEIQSAERHPQADKLQICQVFDGKDSWQVICGAPNACAGLKVAMAQIGAVLPGDFKIKKAKLRGVESHGMLCSGSELGISDDQDGIMELPANAPLGQDLRQYLSLDDMIIDVDLTPNRGDCLSLLGIAREVSTLHDCELLELACSPVAAETEQTLGVQLDAPEGCPRYIGRVITGLNVAAASPAWLVERLERSGIRSIDAVVDVTNYVMLELGQPMHAFDLAEVSSGIRVRFAAAGESLVLLDGQEVQLSPETLVIADQNRPLAIAGVMGGEHSGIGPETQAVFLESAFFDPITLAGKARHYGLHTDSSHRFERGVDPELCLPAMERATALLLAICGGQAGPVVEVRSQAHLPVAAEIELQASQIEDVLGLALPESLVEQILSRLGFALLHKAEQSWTFKAPSWRFDMAIYQDLIEELARVYGYNRLPLTAPKAELRLQAKSEKLLPEVQLRDRLLSLGYQEVITYSFVAKELQALVDDRPVTELLNPISAEMAVMRTNMVAGLLKTLQYNQARQQSRVRIQETGLTFLAEQQLHLAGLAAGDHQPLHWTGKARKLDFFDVKADVESLLAMSSGNGFEFVACQKPGMHPGQCASIRQQGQEIGYLAAVHPQVLQTLDLKGPVFVFELNLSLLANKVLPQHQSLSRFPSSSRDLALVMPADVAAGDLLAVIRQQAGELVQSVQLFDLYQGESLGAGFKSLAIQISWQHPERTLSDDEINAWVANILQAAEQQCQAKLRQ